MIDRSKTCKLLAGVDVSVRLLLKDVVIHLHRTPFYAYVLGVSFIFHFQFKPIYKFSLDNNVMEYVKPGE